MCSACVFSRLAFCAWILSNVLFCIPVPLYGIYMMFATAISIIFSLVSFATVRQVPICNIHFGTSILRTKFGFSFWISFATGKCLTYTLLFNLQEELQEILVFLQIEDLGEGFLLFFSRGVGRVFLFFI